jgi:hypothetical protein
MQINLKYAVINQLYTVYYLELHYLSNKINSKLIYITYTTFSHTYSIWGSDIFNKIDHTSIIFEVVFFRQIISQNVSKFKK